MKLGTERSGCHRWFSYCGITLVDSVLTLFGWNIRAQNHHWQELNVYFSSFLGNVGGVWEVGKVVNSGKVVVGYLIDSKRPWLLLLECLILLFILLLACTTEPLLYWFFPQTFTIKYQKSENESKENLGLGKASAVPTSIRVRMRRSRRPEPSKGSGTQDMIYCPYIRSMKSLLRKALVILLPL
jgi:hypothetical protein